ncbi:MAG: hypothetical protein FWG84_09285 [Bacteroidales bacterium]|nr:hypothetical protein [Bacteroidales bacterium]
MDTTLNILNFEVGRLWNNLGNQINDTLMFDNSIRYFEAYLSNFKIKSKQYPKGEKDSTEYHKTYQNLLLIKRKNLSLKQQIRDLNEYDSLLKTYEGKQKAESAKGKCRKRSGSKRPFCFLLSAFLLYSCIRGKKIRIYTHQNWV